MSDLKQLHEAATPAPWIRMKDGTFSNPDGLVFGDCEFGFGSGADGALIVVLRNAYAEGRLVEVGRCGECKHAAADLRGVDYTRCREFADDVIAVFIDDFCSRFAPREGDAL